MSFLTAVAAEIPSRLITASDLHMGALYTTEASPKISPDWEQIGSRVDHKIHLHHLFVNMHDHMIKEPLECDRLYQLGLIPAFGMGLPRLPAKYHRAILVVLNLY